MLKRTLVCLLLCSFLSFSAHGQTEASSGTFNDTGQSGRSSIKVEVLSTGDTAATIRATVVGGSGVATGVVTFFAGEREIGSSPIDSTGTATITLPEGMDPSSVRAQYTGDERFNAGSPQPAFVSVSPVLTSSPAAVDFGGQGLNIASTPVQKITLTNTGTAPAVLSSISLTGINASDFVITADTCKLSPSSLAIGASCVVSIDFAPAGLGSRSASLTISSDAGASPLDVPLTGVGGSGPIANLPSSPIVFAALVPGSTSSRTLILRNTGTSSLTISSLSLSGTNSTEFSKSGTCTNALTLTENGSCTIAITFKPKTIGSKSATLTISDNAGDSPQTLNLNGSAVNASFVKVAPALLSFTVRQVGTSSTGSSATVTNSGNLPLNISSWNLTGYAASDYTVTAPSCSNPINPKGTCSFSVVFTPTETGARAAQVQIISDAANSPFTFPLSGTGTNAALGKLSVTALNFGVHPVGQQTTASSIKLSNTGTAGLSVIGLNLGGVYAGDYAAVPDPSCASIAPFGSCTIAVSFTAGAVGTRPASLAIVTNANALPIVTLTGVGTNGGIVSLSKTTLSFGTQQVGQPTAQPPSVSLSNVGSGPLTITGMAVVGKNPGDFAASTDCPISPLTLPVQGSCHINITFTAYASGTRSATLSIFDDGALPNPQTISLSGTGATVNGVVLIMPSSVLTHTLAATGTVVAGNTSGATVQLSANNTAIFQSWQNAQVKCPAEGLPGTVTIPSGSQNATFQFCTSNTAGSATITASIPNVATTTTIFQSLNRQINFSVLSPLVATGSAITASLGLVYQAEDGGANINLTSSDTTAATITPATASFNAQQTTTASQVQVQALAAGTTTLTASSAPGSAGYTAVSIALNVVNPSNYPKKISVGQNLTVAPGQSLPLSLSLSQPAPSGGLNVILQSSNPAVLSVPATVFIPPGTMVPQVQPAVTGIGCGAATVTPYDPSGTFLGLPSVVNVQYGLSFSPPSISVFSGGSYSALLNLSAAATAGGVQVALSVDDPTLASVSSTATVSPYQTYSALPIKGLNPGSTTLRAAAIPPCTGSASVPLTTNPAPSIALFPATVGVNLETTTSGTLSSPAPAGNVTVTVTSTDAHVLLATDPTATGMSSLNLVVAAGTSAIPPFYVQAFPGVGSVTITATGTNTQTINGLPAVINYAQGSATITVVPSGFFISSGPISTSVGSPDVGLTLTSAPLDPNTLNLLNPLNPAQLLRGGIGSVTVALTNSAANVGTLASNSLSITGGSSSTSTTFHALSPGTATIAVVEPTGFSTPASQTQISAVVNGNGFVVPSTIVLGNALQTAVSGISLTTPAPAGNLSMTVTSSDPSRLVVSSDPTVAGSVSLTLTVPAGSETVPGFYIQSVPGSSGVLPTGAVQVQVQASGPGLSSFNVNFAQTGFVLFSGCSSSTLSTTNLSSNSPLNVALALLDANGQPTLIDNTGYPSPPCFTGNQTLAPGFGPVIVAVSSDTPSVGTVTSGGGAAQTTNVQFNTNEEFEAAAFYPVAQGTANLSINTPAGFLTPVADQQVAVTVAASSLNVSSTATGWGLETPLSLSLATSAPPGNEQIIVTSADPSKVVLSLDPTLPGTSSVNATVYAGNYSPTVQVYAQALNSGGINVASTAQVNLIATSADFGQTTNTMTLVPSGFVLSPPYPYCFQTSESLTLGGADAGLVVLSVPLDPSSYAFTNPNFYCYAQIGQQVNPLAVQSAPVAVSLSSSDTTIGSINASPVTFNAGDYVQNTGFHPLMTGNATVSLSTTPPNGFNTPSNFQQVAMSVSAPVQNISVTAPNVGHNLETTVNAYLSPAPLADTSITLTSGDPNRLLLSTDPTVLGSTSVTIPVSAGSGTSSTLVYEQGLSDNGTVTINFSSPGYNAVNASVSLVPSGFVLWLSNYTCNASSFSTNPISGDQSISVYLVPLDPTTLNFNSDCYVYSYAQQLRPNLGPVSIAVNTSPGTGGTITVSPLTFNTGDTNQSTTFHPTAVGNETISLGSASVPGFATPSNDQQIAAAIQTPALSLSAQPNLGFELQVPVTISLAVAAPAGGETITLSSSSTQLLLSSDPSVQGSPSTPVSVVVPAGTSSSTIYAQSSASQGAATITATSADYSQATTTVNLVPTGVVLTAYYCQTSPTTSVLLGASPLNLYLAPLDPVTLNASTYSYYYYCPAVSEALAPGVPPVSVNLTSNNPTVGTPTATPVTFSTGQNTQPTGFQPSSDGVATIAVTTPNGLATPSNYQTVTFNVVPTAVSAPDVSVGCNMQLQNTVSFGAAAPAGATVSVQSQDVTKLQLSMDNAHTGTNQLTFALNGGETSVSFYVQARNASCALPPGANAIANIGYNVNISGADYASAGGTVHVMPSGFAITGVNSSFFTTVNSANTTLQISPVSLDPIYLNVIDFEQVVPGMTNTQVPVLTSTKCGGALDTTVGEIPPPAVVVFNGADTPNYQITSFEPLATGATVIYVPSSTGFSQASNYNCITANVTN